MPSEVANKAMKNCLKLFVGACLFLLLTVNLPAQAIYATLTGVVSDQTGAVVPGATVKLTNEQSGSVRETVSNTDGYYTFASVAVGNFTYKLTVEAKGFVGWQATGLSILAGEKRNVNVSLQVGSTSQTVEVTGVATSVVPVDSGEISQTLTTKELQNFIQVGSNAAEYLKIMPGFGINNGTTNKANYSGQVIGINANGDGGSQSPLNNAYSYNGLPSNSLDILADGAHASDPGCNCDTPVNPNSDMIAEFRVMTSNFSAENQKGPAVFSTVAKSGGSEFHGSAFFYARDYALNSNDSYFNATGAPKPQNEYFYPGFTFGGPVIIPKTNFNKNHDKLFFFTGFEYFYQVLDTGLLQATVPTAGMLQGNFSPSEIAKLGNITESGAPPLPLTPAALAKYPGGIIPQSQLDPNMVALMKLYPKANADPNATGGFNYVQSEIFNQNNSQWMTRVDYNISDNTKLFVRYNMQRETQQFPVGLWWRNGNQVPYPTPVQGLNSSDSVTASLTHVFSPSMTNEFVFGYTYIGFPNVFENPSLVNRTNVGYTYPGLYKNGVAQIPSFGSSGQTALIFNPGGFEAGGASQGLYADKWMPSVSDTLTKVIGTHTIKAGGFWEWIRNAQPANNNTNGDLSFNPVGNPYTLGNPYADMVMGNMSSYNETSFNRINDISYDTIEAFVQDDWKVTKNLTLNLGLRISHLQPWQDRLGYGYSVFNYANYSPSCTPNQYCGFLWNKRDPNVPNGGFPTRFAFYQPRFGLAYDPTGSGKTVIRGGWGRYYYHSGQFTNGLDVSAGVQTANLSPAIVGGPLLASALSSIPFQSQALSPFAVDSKDNKMPYTDNYNFTISRQLPWSSLLEVSYVGNQTHDIPGSGNGGSLGLNTLNINLVPYGSMLASKNGGADPNKLNPNAFRPLQGFSDLYVATNNGWSNYNSLQVTWTRTRGRYTMSFNYTYSKALGIIGFYDQYNLNNDYGVLPQNRTHIFNAAYSIDLGKPVHNNKILGALGNGWQLSGITQLESGADLTGFGGQNFGMNLNNATMPGTNQLISGLSIFGTPDLQLNPILTCNPASGLGQHQYLNPSCFAMPTTPGLGGPNILPAIYGPAFFNSDLALFKNFYFTESRSLQFRVDGYNFLNHPLYSFVGSDLSLSFNPTTGKVNNPNFGTATNTVGNRIIQLAVKFFF